MASDLESERKRRQSTGEQGGQNPHGLKAKVIDGVMPQIELNFADAAKAFATSKKALTSMAERGVTLAIQPHDNTKTVTIELIQSVPDVRRNLWNELLETLQTGRLSLSEKKITYQFVYSFIHWFDEANGGLNPEVLIPPESLLPVKAFNRVWNSFQAGQSPEEDELGVLAAYGWALYGQLGRGMQEEVLSPLFLRTSGIALEN